MSKAVLVCMKSPMDHSITENGEDREEIECLDKEVKLAIKENLLAELDRLEIELT